MNRPLTEQEHAERARAEAVASSARQTRADGREDQADGGEDRGQAGAADDAPRDHRAGADAEHQRQQQQARSRTPSAAHDAQIERQERDQRHQRGAVAGGQRIAAPDGGLAQKGDGQQRKGCRLLPAHQRDQRGDANGHEQHEHGGSVLALMRCACSSASSAGTMKATNRTSPMPSKVQGCSRAGRGGSRSVSSAATTPSGRLTRNTLRQPKCCVR